jgi:hypothetical protein
MRLMVVAMLVLAGCAAPEPVVDSSSAPTASVDETTAAICGVIVDQTIQPLDGVAIVGTMGAAGFDALTDADGQFCVGDLEPGFYNVAASKPGYTKVAVQTDAEAGVARPPLVRIVLERLFDQDPLISQFKFDGRLACHVQASLTAPCVTDWTQLVPGCGSGCVPPLRTIMGDARDFMDEIDAGWQSHIVEMTWTQSSQATSKEMGLIIRDSNVGGASHQFAAMEGASPLWVHLKEGEVHPTNRDAPDRVPTEGYADIIHFAGVRTPDGDVAAAAVEQKFSVFRHTFYYAAAPEDWSFLAGDDMPF